MSCGLFCGMEEVTQPGDQGSPKRSLDAGSCKGWKFERLALGPAPSREALVSF